MVPKVSSQLFVSCRDIYEVEAEQKLLDEVCLFCTILISFLLELKRSFWGFLNEKFVNLLQTIKNARERDRRTLLRAVSFHPLNYIYMFPNKQDDIFTLKNV